MIKQISKTSFIIASFCISTHTLAIPQNQTSSLAIVKIKSNYSALVQQCQKLFKEGDSLILAAEKQPGTHLQVKQLKDQLSNSKQLLLKMDTKMQQKSCDKGLIALNNLKKKY